MSIDLFNELIGRYELYRLLGESEADYAAGRTMSFTESMASIRKELSDEFPSYERCARSV